MNPVRHQVLRVLSQMSERYPEWRLGQLVANIALWARQPTEPHDTAIWDLEDEKMLAAMERHLQQRKRKPMPRARKNGNVRLEESLSAMQQAQTNMLQAMANLGQLQTSLMVRLAQIDADIAATNRLNAERFARIEDLLAQHSAILAEHSRMLAALPEAIHQRFGSGHPSRLRASRHARLSLTSFSPLPLSAQVPNDLSDALIVEPDGNTAW